MKLAVLIADGLPDPRDITFHDDQFNIRLDEKSDWDAWVIVLEAVGTGATPTKDGKRWLHTAYQWDWHGWIVGLHSTSTRAEDEDLTKVREIAEGSS